ncbi:MAG: sigma-54-dependent Fis family transcriptional regulator [Bacteroidales bacterium]|jgi:transcriptional regulator with PAS, ATPase and Fis domain|nr:sigma-54-dependent Fis family transcriptional regulator [Bacteroidales bacterium]MDN5348995.1 hypothetical protein [Bacteroidales bacterium]
MELQSIKQRFGIIGHDPFLERAIHIAIQVAPTDLTVLITGESGTGKEVFPKIIHQASARKHGSYIAVNCGAIPEGTIDSELFGHEKGSFTGAHEARKGYFEVVDGGTIFLDEVAELPLSTQVRLLRVLETGEFLKVGSSKVIKTDVRVVAASNVNIPEAIAKGEFRQDLFYRLNTVPIMIPPLRERKEDILMLFKKFANDFAEKYRMPPLKLTDEAIQLLEAYHWPGNIRQLKNVTEQISIIEKEKLIDAPLLKLYLPADHTSSLPVLYKGQEEKEKLSERDILYKVLFDMKKDILDLRKTMSEIISAKGVDDDFEHSNNQLIRQYTNELDDFENKHLPEIQIQDAEGDKSSFQPSEVINENLSLEKTEIEMIRRALEKHKGKRKSAAQELGISERTLYRKIKEYNINL